MEIDPTRPAMTDGGHAMVDQSMPINGVHYGESDLRDYPDEAYTCDKLFHQPQTIWKYDTTKPGFLGESLFTTGQAPSFYAGVQGESAFLGRSESARGESLWVKMCSEGYRWAGLGAVHFWMADTTGGIYNSWQPVAVLCRQWNWTFASGSKVARTLKVFNDTRFADPIEVAWQLKVGPGVIAQGGKTFNVAPGMAEQFEIALDMPRVSQPRTAGQLVLTARRGGKEVFRDIETAGGDRSGQRGPPPPGEEGPVRSRPVGQRQGTARGPGDRLHRSRKLRSLAGQSPRGARRPQCRHAASSPPQPSGWSWPPKGRGSSSSIRTIRCTTKRWRPIWN